MKCSLFILERMLISICRVREDPRHLETPPVHRRLHHLEPQRGGGEGRLLQVPQLHVLLEGRRGLVTPRGRGVKCMCALYGARYSIRCALCRRSNSK